MLEASCHDLGLASCDFVASAHETAADWRFGGARHVGLAAHARLTRASCHFRRRRLQGGHRQRPRGVTMSARIDLACMVCAEEFVISAETYGDHSQVVQCPCCGSTDLVPLVFDEGVTLSLRAFAA